MKKKWREFEELVSRIEKLLSPQGAIVKSPDRLRDKVTGQIREVDASIRYVVGSVQVLITIECRDRKSTQDDTWIEQLATKKQKIGASHTIAVSSSHFTKPAIESAELYGIELRIIEPISDENILSWINKIDVINVICMAKLKNLRIKVYDPDPNVSLDPSIIQSIKSEELRAKIFLNKVDNKAISIRDFLEFFITLYSTSKGVNDTSDALEKIVLKQGKTFTIGLHPQFRSFFENVPENGAIVTRTFDFNIRDKGLSIRTVKGSKYVKNLNFDILVAKKTEKIPVERMIQYATTQKPVSNIVETDIELLCFDHKRDLILSYSAPVEEHAPVTLIISSKNDFSVSLEEK